MTDNFERCKTRIEKKFSDFVEQCPRFDVCSVPICPLDEKFELRVHVRGDRICPYIYRWFRKDRKKVPEFIYQKITECSDRLKKVLKSYWNIAQKKALISFEDRFLKGHKNAKTFSQSEHTSETNTNMSTSENIRELVDENYITEGKQK